ncbi:Protein mab-21-like 3 [Chelonia mydas]|uniref:Protein mab-21-like 3 n=1 Tax=Chelonia mydas TaxID=8469 RepID=M7AJL7_CHEMY|nr:Protein mab-21-like 3 [Chelonia mydas]
MEEEQAESRTVAQEFLNWFLRRHVYPEQREHRRRERECQRVQALVSRIMARVHQWNTLLFTGEAILVGSQAQDLHVRAESSSSDYDFLAPIQYNTNVILLGTLYSAPCTELHFLPSWLSLKSGVPVYRWENKLVVDYNKVTLRKILDEKNVDWGRKDLGLDLMEEDIKEINGRQKDLWRGGIDPFLVARKFHEFVENALAEGNVRLSDFAKCSAVQLSLEVDGQAVSIDLVPTIRNKVDMSMDWPRQDLRDIDLNGAGWRREALQLLKQINMDKWVPRYGKVLTSYHLKMVLFWASDLNPEPENWATVLDALGTLLKVLEFSLEKKQLPSYFLPSMNFFNWHRSEEENSLKNRVLEVLRLEVRLMRWRPGQYLQLSYDLAKPQGPGPFIQRERELDEFRRKHQKLFEEFKNLKEEKQPGQGAASIFFAQHRHLGSCLQLNILRQGF